jgi:protein-disulfide isomerase
VVPLIVAAVVAVGVVGYAVSSNVGGSDMVVAPIEVEGLDDPTRLAELAQPVTLGSPDAPIKIMEFADYQCPSCQYFQQSVKPRLDLAYLEEGIAQLVFYDFPLNMHPHAFLAARAARCAGDQGQERYWQYHDALFQNQPSWSFSTAPPARQFVNYAEGLGLDGAAFEGCLRSDRHAEVVTANLHLAMELNMPGTPSVMIQGPNDRLPRRVDWNTLDTLFEAIVTEVEAIQQGTQGAQGAEG